MENPRLKAERMARKAKEIIRRQKRQILDGRARLRRQAEEIESLRLLLAFVLESQKEASTPVVWFPNQGRGQA